MKHVIIISFILFFFSCHESKEEALLATINNITKNNQENFYVVILSDTDCASCINHVVKKASTLNGSKVYGIYFTDKKISLHFLSHIDHIIRNKNLPIKWFKTMDMSLMKLLYQTIGVANGPYLVKVSKNQITLTTVL